MPASVRSSGSENGSKLVEVAAGPAPALGRSSEKLSPGVIRPPVPSEPVGRA